MAKQFQIIIVVLDYPTIVVTKNMVKLLHFSNNILIIYMITLMSVT